MMYTREQQPYSLNLYFLAMLLESFGLFSILVNASVLSVHFCKINFKILLLVANFFFFRFYECMVYSENSLKPCSSNLYACRAFHYTLFCTIRYIMFFPEGCQIFFFSFFLLQREASWYVARGIPIGSDCMCF